MTTHGPGSGPRRPPTGVDSIPHHHCDEPGCGGPVGAAWRLPYAVASRGDGFVAFCSLGCVSRWAIRQELRQEKP